MVILYKTSKLIQCVSTISKLKCILISVYLFLKYQNRSKCDIAYRIHIIWSKLSIAQKQFCKLHEIGRALAETKEEPTNNRMIFDHITTIHEKFLHLMTFINYCFKHELNIQLFYCNFKCSANVILRQKCYNGIVICLHN